MLRILSFAFIAVAFFVACDSKKKAPGKLENFVIVPGNRVGPITMDSCNRDIVEQMYGSLAKADSVTVPGNQKDKGLVLFPDDPARRLEIWWYLPHSTIFPASFRVADEGSFWRTNTGIRIGSTLKQVEQVNGKPFMLVTVPGRPGILQVANWNGGNTSVVLGLEFSFEGGGEREGEFPSDDPLVQHINPAVSAITTFFRVPPTAPIEQMETK